MRYQKRYKMSYQRLWVPPTYTASINGSLFSILFKSQPVCLKLSKVFLVLWVLLPDMAFLELSQFPSNHSPFSKLSKVYCCCVHAASRHGHLFSVSFKSPIFQAFQSLLLLCTCCQQTWPIILSFLQITAHFSSFPKFDLVV